MTRARHVSPSALIRAVLADLPIVADPVGSHRAPVIDALCRRFGVPLGSAWCALWLAAVRDALGLAIPLAVGECHPARAESWHQWARATGRLTQTPQLGYATLYDLTDGGAADHVGAAIVSLAPALLTVEGHAPGRTGALATILPVRTRAVLGYVSLYPLG